MKTILTIIYLLFTTTGIFLMKLGGNSIAISLKENVSLKIGHITLLGLLCYICSFLLWQKLLTIFDLSYIVPITTGISQIVIVGIGVLFFKEQLNIANMIGILLIVIGVILLSIKH